MITIKALAEDIGISKVAVTKWLERNGCKDSLQKVGNRYMIPLDIENDIRAYFAHKEPKQSKPMNNTLEAEKQLTSEILALLREQLEAKDREIERLHHQVEDLQHINADMVKAVRELNTIQAMQLTGEVERTMSEQRENDVEPTMNPRANHEQSQEEAKKKRSWMDRLLSRRW